MSVFVYLCRVILDCEGISKVLFRRFCVFLVRGFDDLDYRVFDGILCELLCGRVLLSSGFLL